MRGRQISSTLVLEDRLRGEARHSDAVLAGGRYAVVSAAGPPHGVAGNRGSDLGPENAN